jgi:cellulase/cellobiase CelA1
VTNVGTTAGYWSTQIPFKDTITSLWNARYTLADGVLSLQGPAYDRKLRPGQSTQVGLCATRPAQPAEPPPPAGIVTAKLVVTADWSSGYCAKVAVTNNSAVKVVGWTVDVPNVEGTPGGMWNGRYAMDGTTMHVSGPDWNRDLAAGGINDDAGFCASR